jgi:hypothetical protein
MLILDIPLSEEFERLSIGGGVCGGGGRTAMRSGQAVSVAQHKLISAARCVSVCLSVRPAVHCA